MTDEDRTVTRKILEDAEITEILAEILIRAIKRTKTAFATEWLAMSDQKRFDLSMGMFGKLIDENMQEVVDAFVGKGNATVEVKSENKIVTPGDPEIKH